MLGTMPSHNKHIIRIKKMEISKDDPMFQICLVFCTDVQLSPRLHELRIMYPWVRLLYTKALLACLVTWPPMYPPRISCNVYVAEGCMILPHLPLSSCYGFISFPGSEVFGSCITSIFVLALHLIPSMIYRPISHPCYIHNPMLHHRSPLPRANSV